MNEKLKKILLTIKIILYGTSQTLLALLWLVVVLVLLINNGISFPAAYLYVLFVITSFGNFYFYSQKAKNIYK